MKRYNPSVKISWDGSFEPDMTEDPYGEWGKWEDNKNEFVMFAEVYEKRIKGLADEIKRLQNVIFECNERESLRGSQIGAETIQKVQDVTECNCEKRLYDCFREPFWICPKHGYKKR